MNRVGAKGNIVIERGIREKLGIVPGSEAIQRIEGNRVVLEFLPPVPAGSASGVLAEFFQDAAWLKDDESLNAAIDQAAADEAIEQDRRVVREWCEATGG
jgi:bifunctional DNA-binding transcriptional regulator/antitoxin component of YhaV-PrlF toxin-antitoxin module